MLVKIGNTIYDAEKEPIMIMLSKEDRENIKNMAPGARKYCVYPDEGWTENQIKNFMKTDDETKEKL